MVKQPLGTRKILNTERFFTSRKDNICCDSCGNFCDNKRIIQFTRVCCPVQCRFLWHKFQTANTPHVPPSFFSSNPKMSHDVRHRPRIHRGRIPLCPAFTDGHVTTCVTICVQSRDHVASYQLPRCSLQTVSNCYLQTSDDLRRCHGLCSESLLYLLRSALGHPTSSYSLLELAV